MHHNYIIFSEFGFATWDVTYWFYMGGAPGQATTDSPIILFFYSQIFSLLFTQTSPIFSQTSPFYTYIILQLVFKSFAKHSDDMYISEASQKQQKLIAMTSHFLSDFLLHFLAHFSDKGRKEE